MIRIPLQVFTPALRRRFLEGGQPFGALLADDGIRFEAHSLAYFTCAADADLAARSGIREGTRSYGRVNQLRREDGVLLCETVEVLPRARSWSRRWQIRHAGERARRLATTEAPASARETAVISAARTPPDET